MDASRDVERVVSDVSVLCPRSGAWHDNSCRPLGQCTASATIQLVAFGSGSEANPATTDVGGIRARSFRTRLVALPRLSGFAGQAALAWATF
jgi:hypothetical protein